MSLKMRPSGSQVPRSAKYIRVEKETMMKLRKASSAIKASMLFLTDKMRASMDNCSKDEYV